MNALCYIDPICQRLENGTLRVDGVEDSCMGKSTLFAEDVFLADDHACEVRNLKPDCTAGRPNPFGKRHSPRKKPPDPIEGEEAAYKRYLWDIGGYFADAIEEVEGNRAQYLNAISGDDPIVTGAYTVINDDGTVSVVAEFESPGMEGADALDESCEDFMFLSLESGEMPAEEEIANPCTESAHAETMATESDIFYFTAPLAEGLVGMGVLPEGWILKFGIPEGGLFGRHEIFGVNDYLVYLHNGLYAFVYTMIPPENL